MAAQGQQTLAGRCDVSDDDVVEAMGCIETPMAEQMRAANQAGALEATLKDVPIRRLGRPEEIADAVLWLCSDAASFVIGHSLAVDGGVTVQ